MTERINVNIINMFFHYKAHYIRTILKLFFNFSASFSSASCDSCDGSDWGTITCSYQCTNGSIYFTLSTCPSTNISSIRCTNGKDISLFFLLYLLSIFKLELMFNSQFLTLGIRSINAFFRSHWLRIANKINKRTCMRNSNFVAYDIRHWHFIDST